MRSVIKYFEDIMEVRFFNISSTNEQERVFYKAKGMGGEPIEDLEEKSILKKGDKLELYIPQKPKVKDFNGIIHTVEKLKVNDIRIEKYLGEKEKVFSCTSIR